MSEQVNKQKDGVLIGYLARLSENKVFSQYFDGFYDR